MYSSLPSEICVFLACTAFLPAFVSAASHHDRDPELFHYKSRPDLKPPRWDITVYDRDRLAEGYWFVGIKPSLDQTIGTHQSWFGPHIYDDEGELVWAGSDQFDTSNVMDFRLSNIGGDDCLTVLDRDRKSGLIINSNYEIVDSFLTDFDHNNVNGHELNFMNNGSSVLVLRNNDQDVPKDEADWFGWHKDKPCRANYMAFRELDADDDWRPSFDWSALGHIKLQEATSRDGSVESKCEGYDFIHTNSLDKTTDGDYLSSGRHTDTIYKISHEDKSVVWRLGGKFSDFDMGKLKFSRQHDIRFRGQNDTHMMISFLDNAKGQDSTPPTHDFSRGLHLALDLKKMVVTVINTYDHPYKDRDDENERYANRRGNMQMQDNGNVFMGWSERALQSEHTANGTLLMEARFMPDWVGAYRNYKFPYVGRPLTKPDVFAASYFTNRKMEHLPTTQVAVSWNGDTEVRKWNVYARTEDEGKEELMDTLDRTGFETSYEYKGMLKTVRFEGLDKKGKAIGDSGEIRTIEHPSPPPEEDYKDPTDTDDDDDDHHGFLGNPNVTFALLFILGAVLSAGAVLFGWLGYLPLKWLTQRTGGLSKFRDAIQYKKVEEEDFDEDRGEDLPIPLTSGKIRLQSPTEPP